MSNNEITDFEYPHINRTDYIDESLSKILARDDASKRSFRRKESFPNVTADDVGMKVWLAGDGVYQLVSVDPEPYWKKLTDDKREPTYNDWVIDNYQPKSAVLTSMAKLGSVSNAIPYFNGPSDIQSTSITPLTRNILAASDAPTVRKLLGLGSAALINTPINGNLIEQGTISKDKIDADFARNLGWTTGDVKLTYKTRADAGWVMMNDGSIGNASSGATTRANADCYDLFVLLWNIPACGVQTFAGVNTNKGSSAVADWASNKRLVLPKTLGRALAGAGNGAGLSNRALGSVVGKETFVNTGDQSVRLSDGTLIQWGIGANNGWITFPKPFSNTNYSVTTMSTRTGQQIYGWQQLEGRENTRAYIMFQNYENSHYQRTPAWEISWIAVGK